jgi:hypothetical protein
LVKLARPDAFGQQAQVVAEGVQQGTRASAAHPAYAGYIGSPSKAKDRTWGTGN